MKKRLYLCGPITGIRDYNKPAFDNAASALRSAGYEVFNPLENGVARDAPWEQHMRADLAQMMTCDALAVLPGAHFSKGATLKVRALVIRENDNPAVPVIEKGIEALNRAVERFKRIQKWGLDGQGRQDLIDAVSLYEEIFWASSPQQMHDAAMTAFRWIEIQNVDKVAA